MYAVIFMFSAVVYVSVFFFFSSRRRHTRWTGDWSSDVCSSDLKARHGGPADRVGREPRDGGSCGCSRCDRCRSEERRVGKGVDLGGRRIIKKKKKKRKRRIEKEKGERRKKVEE